MRPTELLDKETLTDRIEGLISECNALEAQRNAAQARAEAAELEAQHQRKCAVEWFDKFRAAEARVRELEEGVRSMMTARAKLPFPLTEICEILDQLSRSPSLKEPPDA
jgi:chromosome segregation ATPase